MPKNSTTRTRPSTAPRAPAPYTELVERGLITHIGGGTLDEVLAVPRKVYLGVEPSAESLHVGNLVPVMLLKHLCDRGHRPYLLVGGGTGLIGDPKESGERPLLDPKVVTRNTRAIRTQLAGLLRTKNLTVVNNAEWLTKLGLIPFLRDIGKHFTVNQLIKRDIIKRRLETDEDSISYTEFSYSLLQGYDFLYLHERYGINLQIGGSDQWANILSGVDLIRRKRNAPAYALTVPIVVDKTTGKKFGKSEGNAVWLDPKRTSPFAFYQFWYNTRDEDVAEYLKLFSFLPLADIKELMEAHRAAPQARRAQRSLAREVTAFVHGPALAVSAERVSEIVYGERTLEGISSTDRAMVCAEVPHVPLRAPEVRAGFPLSEALVRATLASSKGEARRVLEAGGVSVNGAGASVGAVLTADLFRGGLVLVRRGKKVAVFSVRR